MVLLLSLSAASKMPSYSVIVLGVLASYAAADTTDVETAPASESRRASMTVKTSHPSSSATSKSSVTSSRPPSSPTNPASSSSTSPANAAGPHDSGVLNYYFLLIAILICLIGVIWWSLMRLRQRKVAAARSSGNIALAQDLEGWASRRRSGRAVREMARTRTEEGLDEQGEAPPPYVPREPPNALTRTGSTRSNHAHNQVPGLEGRTTMPKPPGYEESATRTVDGALLSGSSARP